MRASAPTGMPKAIAPIVGEDALVHPVVQAPTIAQVARSEAERAERETGQMRACTPTQDAPAPRESAVKSASHPAAPVGESSQIRRHHLTPTPVQQLCTHVQSCDQSGLFFWTVHGPFSFPQDGKENGGCIPAGQAPCGSRHPPGRRSAAPPNLTQPNGKPHPFSQRGTQQPDTPSFFYTIHKFY